jgi:hypothetical protein
MLRDCNTCANHKQGAAWEDMPSDCQTCLRITYMGNPFRPPTPQLPFWEPMEQDHLELDDLSPHVEVIDYPTVPAAECNCDGVGVCADHINPALLELDPTHNRADGGGKAKTYDTKLSNPKDIIGSTKLPLHLWPTTATALGALGLLDGALKYGRSNFRAVGVRASIYYDAARRHLDAWFEGEDADPDSKLSHLAHALACLAIIVDAQAAGKLNDDRMVAGGYREFLSSLTPHVARLKDQHADKSPKHYTIAEDVA